jgi:hypothetical protein
LLAQSSSTTSHPLGGTFVEDVPGHRVVDRLAVVVYRDDVSLEAELVISLAPASWRRPGRSTAVGHGVGQSPQPGRLAISGSEAEDEHQGMVDRAQRARIEPPGRAAQALRIDDRRLFDEDTCFAALERDRRPETRRSGMGRRRSDEHSAELEELVRLNNDRVASTALLVSPHAARSGQTEDLASDHSAGRLGRELG